jgi:hypothetical protein
MKPYDVHSSFLKNRVERWLSLLWLVSFLIGLLAACSGIVERRMIPLKVAKNDGFTELIGPDLRECSGAMKALPSLIFWRNWTPERGVEKGIWDSGDFEVDSPSLVLPLAGYPTATGNQVYLERVSDSKRILVNYGNPHEKWSECRVDLPSDWQGSRIRIVAECEEAVNYIGIGTPMAASRLESTLVWASLVFKHGVLLLLFASILKALSTLAPRSLSATPLRQAFFALAALAGYGYLHFFVLHHAGVLPAILVSAGLVVYGGVLLVRDLGMSILNPVRCCLGSTTWGGAIFLSLLYTLTLYLQDTVSSAYASNYRFYPATWSTDNQLPVELALALVSKGDIFNLGWGVWLVSDRPPVLAGILALPAYLLKAQNIGTVIGTSGVWLNIAAIVVLCSWWIPVRFMVTECGVENRMQRIVMLTLACCPFLFFNSIYAWGKLLSATLFLAGVQLEREDDTNEGPSVKNALSGACFGLSLLSHGSAAFGVAGYFLYRLFAARRCLKSLPGLALIVFVFLLFGVSWSIWGKVFNPPGNALAKFAFAGTFGFSDPGKGLVDTIRTAYSTIDFPTWLGMKRDAFLTFWGLYQPYWRPPSTFPEGLEIRAYQFLNLFPALGLLSFGIFPFLTSRTSKRLEFARHYLFLALLGMTFQTVTMWSHHNLHHMAYGTALIFHVCFTVGLMGTSHPRLGQLVCLGSALIFVLSWIIFPLFEFGRINIGVFVAAGVMFTLVVFATLSASRGFSKSEIT